VSTRRKCSDPGQRHARIATGDRAAACGSAHGRRDVTRWPATGWVPGGGAGTGAAALSAGPGPARAGAAAR
jgi:hypothetical protein